VCRTDPAVVHADSTFDDFCGRDGSDLEGSGSTSEFACILMYDATGDLLGAVVELGWRRGRSNQRYRLAPWLISC
jgi:hypothetical protein